MSPVPDSFKKAPSIEAAAVEEFGESIYTMTALNRTLAYNPEPLRLFSALRDFSGENIAFLTAVASWTALWPSDPSMEPPPASRGHDLTGQLSRRDLFKRAVCIYARTVSQSHADVPINIAARHRERLDAIFGRAARVLYGEGYDVSGSLAVTPFGEPSLISAEKATAKVAFTGLGDYDTVAERVQWWGDIPDEFNANVFREAEKSVKYLVLTNTWPKFVKEMLDLRPGDERPTGRLRWREWWLLRQLTLRVSAV